MKSLKEYQAMTPAQLLEEPDAPESLKIKARIILENAKMPQEELSEAARLERTTYERAMQERAAVDMQRTNC